MATRYLLFIISTLFELQHATSVNNYPPWQDSRDYYPAWQDPRGSLEANYGHRRLPDAAQDRAQDKELYDSQARMESPPDMEPATTFSGRPTRQGARDINQGWRDQRGILQAQNTDEGSSKYNQFPGKDKMMSNSGPKLKINIEGIYKTRKPTGNGKRKSKGFYKNSLTMSDHQPFDKVHWSLPQNSAEDIPNDPDTGLPVDPKHQPALKDATNSLSSDDYDVDQLQEKYYRLKAQAGNGQDFNRQQDYAYPYGKRRKKRRTNIGFYPGYRNGLPDPNMRRRDIPPGSLPSLNPAPLQPSGKPTPGQPPPSFRSGALDQQREDRRLSGLAHPAQMSTDKPKKSADDVVAPRSPCDPTPCMNGGTCKADDKAGFICACPFEYRGKFCQKATMSCESLTCSAIKDCVATPAGSVCICAGRVSGQICLLDDAKPSEWQRVKMVVHKDNLYIAEAVLGTLLGLICIVAIVLAIHFRQVAKRRKKLRASFKEALDSGYLPPYDPPDWLDISNDMIRQRLCCKKHSKFPDSYLPMPKSSASQQMLGSKTDLLQREEEFDRLINAKTYNVSVPRSNTSVNKSVNQNSLYRLGSSGSHTVKPLARHSSMSKTNLPIAEMAPSSGYVKRKPSGGGSGIYRRTSGTDAFQDLPTQNPSRDSLGQRYSNDRKKTYPPLSRSGIAMGKRSSNASMHKKPSAIKFGSYPPVGQTTVPAVEMPVPHKMEPNRSSSHPKGFHWHRISKKIKETQNKLGDNLITRKFRQDDNEYNGNSSFKVTGESLDASQDIPSEYPESSPGRISALDIDRTLQHRSKEDYFSEFQDDPEQQNISQNYSGFIGTVLDESRQHIESPKFVDECTEEGILRLKTDSHRSKDDANIPSTSCHNAIHRNYSVNASTGQKNSMKIGKDYTEMQTSETHEQSHNDSRSSASSQSWKQRMDDLKMKIAQMRQSPNLIEGRLSNSDDSTSSNELETWNSDSYRRAKISPGAKRFAKHNRNVNMNIESDGPIHNQNMSVESDTPRHNRNVNMNLDYEDINYDRYSNSFTTVYKQQTPDSYWKQYVSTFLAPGNRNVNENSFDAENYFIPARRDLKASLDDDSDERIGILRSAEVRISPDKSKTEGIYVPGFESKETTFDEKFLNEDPTTEPELALKSDDASIEEQDIKSEVVEQKPEDLNSFSSTEDYGQERQTHGFVQENLPTKVEHRKPKLETIPESFSAESVAEDKVKSQSGTGVLSDDELDIKEDADFGVWTMTVSVEEGNEISKNKNLAGSNKAITRQVQVSDDVQEEDDEKGMRKLRATRLKNPIDVVEAEFQTESAAKGSGSASSLVGMWSTTVTVPACDGDEEDLFLNNNMTEENELEWSESLRKEKNRNQCQSVDRNFEGCRNGVNNSALVFDENATLDDSTRSLDGSFLDKTYENVGYCAKDDDRSINDYELADDEKKAMDNETGKGNLVRADESLNTTANSLKGEYLKSFESNGMKLYYVCVSTPDPGDRPKIGEVQMDLSQDRSFENGNKSYENEFGNNSFDNGNRLRENGHQKFYNVSFENYNHLTTSNRMLEQNNSAAYLDLQIGTNAHANTQSETVYGDFAECSVIESESLIQDMSTGSNDSIPLILFESADEEAGACSQDSSNGSENSQESVVLQEENATCEKMNRRDMKSPSQILDSVFLVPPSPGLNDSVATECSDTSSTATLVPSRANSTLDYDTDQTLVAEDLA